MHPVYSISQRIVARVSVVALLALVSCASAPTADAGAPDDGVPTADAPTSDDGASSTDARTFSCTLSAYELREACGFQDFVATECSPDGEGWCCPYYVPPASTPCGCYPTGRFARDPCDCPVTIALCDLVTTTWGTRIDEHGCRIADIPPDTPSCLVPPTDAGIDAP